MNTLYYGDNLEVLRKYVKDETVDLCYIDPPFNSKRNYNQIYNNVGGEDRAQAQAFVDTWEWDEQANIGYAELLDNARGRFASQTVDLLKGLAPVLKKGSLLAYLVSMALRVTEIHRVLKPTGSFYLHCFPSATPVRRADGTFAPIACISPGDALVSDAGEVGVVANCLCRDLIDGELVSLRLSGLPEPLECTPEHGIYILPALVVARIRSMWTRNSRYARGVTGFATRRPRVSEADYAALTVRMPARDISAGDYCLMPIDREVWGEDKRKLSIPASRQHNAKPVADSIAVDEAFAELCGYYLAEGNVSSNSAYVNFTLHAKEARIAERITHLAEAVFGVAACPVRLANPNAQRLTLCSVSVGRFFVEHCGTGSGEKRIPLALLKAPASIQRALFAAWAAGDGTISQRENGGALRVTTVSRNLAMQMQQVALRLGAVATVGTGNRPHYRPQDHARQAFRVQVNGRDFAAVGLDDALPEEGAPDSHASRRAFVLGDYLCLPVRAVERRRYTGPVFDLHMEPKHSYCAGGVKVSNCDPTASHYLKIVLDSIFVPQGGDFLNEIVWTRTNSHNVASKHFHRVQDTVFFYSKSNKYTWNTPYTDYSPQQLKRYTLDPVSGRMVTGQDLTMTGNKHRNFTWRGVTPPPHRGWGFSEEQLEALWEQGLILTKLDGTPRLDGRKVFLDEKQGKPVGSVWTDIERIGNTASERLGYPTQKPEALLERIIAASTNEGDCVLDAYCGCGTTVAVAERLKRRWIGVDITYQSIALILRRLEAQYGKGVLANITLNGVPRDMEAANALALKKDDRVRKEFEKWAVLTYSHNRAAINDKKGGDGGIDGVAYFLTGKDDNAKIVFQVKSGNVGRGDIAKLNSDRQREAAELAVFLTLKEPTKGMTDEANGMGLYTHPLMGKHYPRVLIVTIADMLEHGARLDIPLPVEVLKTARTVTEKAAHPELTFDADTDAL